MAFDGPSRTVIDGPFAETRELVAGFWLWEVKDMAEAVEWVKRCPNPMPGPSEIEIRPVFRVADFGEALTPESPNCTAATAKRRPAAEARRSPPRLALLRLLSPNRESMAATDTHQAIETVFRIERARLIAGLARLVRDVGLAEELAQDALVDRAVRMAQDRRPGQSRRLADGRGQAPGHRRFPPQSRCSRASMPRSAGTSMTAIALSRTSKRPWTTMSATSCWG